VILFVAATFKEMESFIKGRPAARINTAEEMDQFSGGEDTGFLVCGVGPLNAVICLERCLEKNPGIRHVVNVGIAGSYDPGVFPLGSVCVVSREIWPEYGVRTGDSFADPVKLGFPLYKKGDHVVWNSLSLERAPFVREAGLNFDPGWSEGVSLTVSGVSSSPDQARKLKNGFQGDVENMEGFALAYCCHLRSVPFMEIRTISNLAGSREKTGWDFKAAFKALRQVRTGLFAGRKP
jgi:futalosine hydrolase